MPTMRERVSRSAGQRRACPDLPHREGQPVALSRPAWPVRQRRAGQAMQIVVAGRGLSRGDRRRRVAAACGLAAGSGTVRIRSNSSARDPTQGSGRGRAATNGKNDATSYSSGVHGSRPPGRAVDATAGRSIHRRATGRS